MSEKQAEATVTEADLQKSIESLMALLETESPDGEDVDSAMAKSLPPGTEGGLTERVGAPSLNPELDMSGAEEEPFLEDEHDEDFANREIIAQGVHKASRSKPMSKSQAADEAPDSQPEEQEWEQEYSEEEEAFAKSLAEAFAEQESIIDAAASSEFAKSLVLGTIEGLSIAHTEMVKSLHEMEARSDEKVVVLAKSLAAIARAVAEIRAEVVAVSNSPARPMAKSVQSVQVLEKSFGGSGVADSPAMLKSRVLSALEKRVQDGKLEAFQLVKFETTGVLDPVLAKEIQSELGL
jgi:murein L,D-transpeptidase YcbB/YkuD